MWKTKSFSSKLSSSDDCVVILSFHYDCGLSETFQGGRQLIVLLIGKVGGLRETIMTHYFIKYETFHYYNKVY